MRAFGGQVGLLAVAIGLSAAYMPNFIAQFQPAPVPGEEINRVYTAPQSPPAQTPLVPAAQPHPNQNGKLADADIQAPTSIKQGEVLRVKVLDTSYFVRSSTRNNAVAELAGRKAEFFQQPDGTFLALVPVSVYQNPGSYPLVIRDPNGPEIKRLNVTVHDGRYRTQNITVSKGNAGLQPLPGEMEAIQKLKDTVTPDRHWDEPFISPTADCMNSPFGVKRFHNGKSTGDYHKGVDLRSPAGRPIKATAGGKVQIATMYRLHGGTVGIDHGQGVGSIYIHMSKINVKPGDVVKKGDVIGQVGSTGFATGPHLHWGLYVNGLPVNPHQWVQGVPACG